ncbi:carbamoyl-phosphate synthase large subunit [Aureispira anguillae]|uniref:Carbamoyl-phosphate synthase large subunit n=1 Tax=Aureispira anguillae TaxID=2864201 RepID=A0A915YIP5_9BACT|nr:carbamoyl-phosphate synthase large subunit [Aureispira anguillae]BDS13922.1 carbamoyl-phosphate synthase large subunit [Aureispira anguillae]
MPKRTDIQKILIIGSGPIVIGQACEFDYSGTQACKALRTEGYQVVLVNSNPATIMTDPSVADVVYIEPLDPIVLEKIIAKERPDALLPTLGGQTALNLCMELHLKRILEQYHVEVIGASIETINKAESRERFAQLVDKIGLKTSVARRASTLEEAKIIRKELGFPCLLRASYTLGGKGSGVAYDDTTFLEIAQKGLEASLTSEIAIEKYLGGWKEFELEMMRDKNDNCIVVCGMENFDALGVHTGDSITVAPIQTLTNHQYQKMRDAAIELMKIVGVETGGANIQFAVCPQTGEMLVVEMNPRVSRSSALASKATGYPIAKFAAKLAVGYTLDELQNDITQKTACFEPALDYCVLKFPRFNFEKFEGNNHLGTTMKALGEVMAIGRTFKEALQKGIRALEIPSINGGSQEEVLNQLSIPNPQRIFYLFEAFKMGWNVDTVYHYSKIDKWFLHQIKQLVNTPKPIYNNPQSIRTAKQLGFSDADLTQALDFEHENAFRNYRKGHKIQPTYKLVDTCAAEFEAYTPYYYSTYEQEDESAVSDRAKIMLVGSGPNRIGQGIEFDYCCVHAAQTIRKMGYECIMVNSNPETVSTDYDVSDKLYFEPISFEEVYNIYEKEQPQGLILQLGGQTPFNLIESLNAVGVPILGTAPINIAKAENRAQFSNLLKQLNIQQPQHAIAQNASEVWNKALEVGYPILIRPSFVIGGSQMAIISKNTELQQYLAQHTLTYPLLIDQFLGDAIEVDVDLICDGTEVVIAGITEQIQPAGVHSGDSACTWPTYTIAPSILEQIQQISTQLALELNIIGLLNVQIALQKNQIYILEANPRASRTLPFISKIQGVNWLELATKVILGAKLKSLEWTATPIVGYAVKEVVFPFSKFEETPIIFTPQMQSTGEVMGMATSLGMAYYKAKLATGIKLPTHGKVLVDREFIAPDFCAKLGFEPTTSLEQADLLISIHSQKPKPNSLALRRMAWDKGIPIICFERELDLFQQAIKALNSQPLEVCSL